MPGPNATWKRAKGRVPLLTSHQRQLLDLLESGSSNQQLADHFLITLNQAKSDINAILGRLELSSREELAGFWTWQRRAPTVPRWVTVVAAAGVALFLILGVAGILAGGDGDAAPAAREPTLAGALPTLATASIPVAVPAAGNEGLLAYITQKGDLMVKPMPFGTPVAVLPAGAGIRTPRWAASGHFLAYVENGWLTVTDGAGAATRLVQVPNDDAWAWSPTEDTLAWFTSEGMFLHDAADNRARAIRGQGAPYPEGPAGLAWSPDGTRILYGLYAATTILNRWDTNELRIFDVGDGSDRLLREDHIPGQGGMDPLGWSGDGRWVFYREAPFYGASVWVDGVPVYMMEQHGGPAVEVGVMTGADDFYSTEGATVGFVDGGWRFAGESPRRLAVLTSGEVSGLSALPAGQWAAGVAVAPGGSAVAAVLMPEPAKPSPNDSATLATRRLWLLARGQDPRQLTDDAAYRDEHPVWSKDGKSILFTRINAAGGASIWRISAAGGRPELVQDGLGLGHAGVSGIYGWIEWSDLLAWWQP